jgi:hypothetical protein
MIVKRLSSVLCLLVASAVACGGGQAPNAPGQVCPGGEERPQLDCSSEFNYDSTKVEGGFAVFGVGSLEAKTEQTALRQIDQETERYAAQARRLCDEYNKCVLDRETYALRSENMRRRMNKVPELYEQLKTTADPQAKRVALAKAYSEFVPEESRVELALSLSVLARKPDQSDLTPIAEGATLPSGTRVAFSVQVSRAAHVYLFQKSPSGELNVLFPDPRITVSNPVPAGQALRIPQGGASFKLDEKDIGVERVFVVASLQPVGALGQAVQNLQGGGAPSASLVKLTKVAEPAANCGEKTRALSFEEDAPEGCSRERGLVFDDEPAAGGGAPASLTARTEAADSLIAREFSFNHTQ